MLNFPQPELEESINNLLRLQESLLRKRDEITAVARILDDNNNHLNSKVLAEVILNSIGLPRNSARYIIRKILQLNSEDTREIFISKFNKLNSFIEILIENVDIFIEHIIHMNEYINNNMIIDINIMRRVCEILAPNEQLEEHEVNNNLFEIIRNFIMIAVDYNSNNNNINIINGNDIMFFINNNVINDNIIINKNNINLEQSTVLINGMQITETIFAKLKDAYVGVTGYYFDNENDFLILSDIIQAIHLIYNGKIEYDFEGSTYTQSFIQLKGRYENIDLGEKIDNSVGGMSVKKFVEEQIKSLTLEKIIQKLKESEQTDVKNSGDILDLILINKVKKLSPSLRRRYSL